MSHENVDAQYRAPVADGMKRYWISWWSYAEDFPEMPFRCWLTGSMTDYKLRPSMADDPRVAELKLPPSYDGFSDVPDEVVDEFYTSRGSFCALIDAADEDTAWHMIAAAFPDYAQRFIEQREEAFTLADLSDRFPR